jgi:hypothetical protein
MRLRLHALLLVGLLLGACAGQAQPALGGDVALQFSGKSCSEEDQRVITEAFHQARRLMPQAIAYLAANPDSPHVRRWFGQGSTKSAQVVMRATADRFNQPDTFTIVCREGQMCQSAFAWTNFPNNRFGFCDRFFQAGAKGFDSRMGVWVHEMTHLAARTRDHVYGPRNSEQLARTDAARAQANADNFEYFVETLP